MFELTASRIALCMGAIIGICLMAAFLLWKAESLKRMIAIGELLQKHNLAWINHTCSEREQQAIQNLIFMPKQLNAYDRELLAKVASRAPADIAKALKEAQ